MRALQGLALQGLLVAAMVSLLTACAGNTVSQRVPPPVVDRGMPPPPPDAPYSPAETYPSEQPEPPAPESSRVIPAQPSTGSSAVVALLERADQQYQTRDLDAAASSLERALRIEPRNPALWHRLAKVRLAQDQPGQALQMAAKSNSLAAGDRRLQASNWRLIAAARRAQGDDSAARAAEQKALQFD